MSLIEQAKNEMRAELQQEIALLRYEIGKLRAYVDETVVVKSTTEHSLTEVLQTPEPGTPPARVSPTKFNPPHTTLTPPKSPITE